MIHDAIVIGGGPAGATAALLLARAGWSVALAEKFIFPRRKVCGEFISAASLELLHALDVAGPFFRQAGPEIRRVGIFAGRHRIIAPMPAPRRGVYRWGRALGREHLDTLLLQRAAAAGVKVWQPFAVTGLEQDEGEVRCVLRDPDSKVQFELRARIAIAAQGSWDRGGLPGQAGAVAARPSDLFGFKAHFHGGDLAPDLMPLLAFPGGYGGMVRSDNDRISLSCCIRRDRLEECRGDHPGMRAAESVLAHILEHCRGVAEALNEVQLLDHWLAVGPIRPGFRPLRQGRVFLAGNAAGEAHPVIAEGISLAMQSAWLLTRSLVANLDAIRRGRLDQAGRDYAAAWRRQFAARIRRSALIARLAMQPGATAAMLPLFSLFPGLLTQCTRLSGKTRLLAGVTGLKAGTAS